MREGTQQPQGAPNQTRGPQTPSNASPSKSPTGFGPASDAQSLFVTISVLAGNCNGHTRKRSTTFWPIRLGYQRTIRSTRERRAIARPAFSLNSFQVIEPGDLTRSASRYGALHPLM